MSDIINYYEELGVSKDLDLEEIKSELIKLERVWHQREINQPEKARRMLVWIDDARAVFQTEETRAKYDQNLENDKPEECSAATDPNEIKRKENVKKWYGDALRYSIDGQNDLSVEAYEKALQYVREEDANYCEINERASHAYEKMGSFDKAISCVNRAIMGDPANLEYYKAKAGVYFTKKVQMMKAAHQGNFVDKAEYDVIVKKWREVLEYILRKAGETNDEWEQVYAWENLADTLYWDDPKDTKRAVQYANNVANAVKELYEDSWEFFLGQNYPFSKGVLEDLKKGSVEYQPYQGENHPSVSSGGCYIATAVYGSYDCPEVWTLRRLRDHTLAHTWIGRLFIKAYYAISPAIVKRFGNSRWFNTFWKKILDKIVYKLKENGVSDKPYSD